MRFKFVVITSFLLLVGVYPAGAYFMPGSYQGVVNGITDKVVNRTGQITGQISDIQDRVQGILDEQVQDVIGEPVQEIDQRLDQTISGISDYLNRTVDKYLGPIKQEVKGAINRSTGALSLPDPIQAGDEIEQKVRQQTRDAMAVNPTLKGEFAKRHFHRGYTRSTVGGVLGQAGQQQMAQETQQTAQAVVGIQQAAKKAESSNVTQDIMRQISVQNAQNAVIQRSIQVETQQTARQTAAANLNLMNISETMDSEQQAKAEQANAEANAFMRQAAFSQQLWRAD